MTDAGNANSGAKRKAPRWLVIALFVSLAVNLVVGGSLVGAVWRAHGPPPRALFIIPNLLGYASTLPHERRKKLWDMTAEARGHIRPFRREVRAAREETVKALVAEPFDQGKFVAAQARQVELENRARTAAQDLYVKIADSLTPEERRAFPLWREHRKAPARNLLDEPDQQAGEPVQPAK
jgi:uncharacterized membrane protein